MLGHPTSAVGASHRRARACGRLTRAGSSSPGTTRRSNSSPVRWPSATAASLQRGLVLVGVLGDLGGVVVADVRVERGDEHQRVVRRARRSAPRSASTPSIANSRKRVAGVGEQVDRVQEVEDHHRLEHVELEVALRAGDADGGVVADAPARRPSSCASLCVGFTLPGMIDEPGSFSGRISSPRPQRGPGRRASGCRWRSSSATPPAS